MTLAKQRKETLLAEVTVHIERKPEVFLAATAAKASVPRGQPYPSEVETAVVDLYENFPALNNLQISKILDVSHNYVTSVVAYEEKEYTPESNRIATDAHLKMLREEFGQRRYEIDPAAKLEYAGQGLPVRAKTLEVTLP